MNMELEGMLEAPEQIQAVAVLPPDIDLHAALVEAVALEPKYQPALALPHTTHQCSEISLRMRNGSAHVLRCLKVWYELSADTFFNAVNIMDRFLTRMRAQPKHLSCIAVSAFHLSCQYTPGYPLMNGLKQVVPDSRDLTTISQSKCSPGDVTRMERIITDKLATDLRSQPPVTPLTLLRLLHAAHAHLSKPHLVPPYADPPLTTLTHKLEIIACDAVATVYRPSELSLALLTQELQGDTKNAAVHQECLNHLYNLCKIKWNRFEECRKVVAELMDEYENQRHSPHRQRLVWKLSNRTLRQLRPTDKFTTRLPTIDERLPPPHPFIRTNFSRDSSDMSVDSSEEEMDYDYDEEFPPLPSPAVALRSPLKSATQSPHKKHAPNFPYPKNSRKYAHTRNA